MRKAPKFAKKISSGSRRFAERIGNRIEHHDDAGRIVDTIARPTRLRLPDQHRDTAPLEHGERVFVAKIIAKINGEKSLANSPDEPQHRVALAGKLRHSLDHHLAVARLERRRLEPDKPLECAVNLSRDGRIRLPIMERNRETLVFDHEAGAFRHVAGDPCANLREVGHALPRARGNFAPSTWPHHFEAVNADELETVARPEQALQFRDFAPAYDRDRDSLALFGEQSKQLRDLAERISFGRLVGNLRERAVIIEAEQNRLVAYEIGYERGRQRVGYTLRPRNSRQAARQAFPHGRAHPGISRTSARDYSREPWPSSPVCALLFPPRPSQPRVSGARLSDRHRTDLRAAPR